MAKRKQKTNHIYRNHWSIWNYICYYCGDKGYEKDHVPAKARMTHGYPKFVVRCCRKCNSILGDRDLPTIGHRKAFIESL